MIYTLIDSWDENKKKSHRLYKWHLKCQVQIYHKCTNLVITWELNAYYNYSNYLKKILYFLI